MPTIEPERSIWTVVVVVDASAGEMEPLERHAAHGLERFGEYSGFLGGALHVSHDRTRLVQYLQWASEAEYRACRDDPAWDDQPSTVAFMDAVERGRARVDERAYRVIQVTDP